PVSNGAAPSAGPPVTARPESRPVLATLEVSNSGPSKGEKYEIRVPLAHVGRGSHNDIVLTDDSVSDTHAKFQRRDDGWYVLDVGSTNGTYVAGQRVTSERRLDGAPDVRFGGVKMVFRATDVPADQGTTGTRAIAGVDRSKLRPPQAASAPVAAPVAATAPVDEGSRGGIPVWVWGAVVLAVAAAVGFFLLNR
ncbi:MAG TPA: FHA domain-containing protein, partial [Gemmatimonadaceae bacterium]